MSNHSLPYLTISEALPLLQSGELNAPDLAAACYWQIGRLNPQLNAFITPQHPEYTGRGGPLEGIPVAVKDLIETRGLRTTCGSPFFKNHVPDADAVVVEKLKKAGALLMGKTNTHEIALGLTGINPHYGATHNPWNPDHITGGSSSGSAAAVAAGMCFAALGTDTGGSIRVPAALCGVVGLKPTYGRVSLRGIFPLSWNLDHCGPITRSARDAALLLNVLAGYDPLDPASVNHPTEDFSASLDAGVEGWKIAVLTGDYVGDAAPGIITSLEEAARILEAQGARIQHVVLDWLRDAAVANGRMVVADAAAYHHERLAAHPDWFGEDVRQRLEMGREISSTEYSLARRAQVEMKRRMEHFFSEFDALLLPTTPITAPRLDAAHALEQAQRLTRFTGPFNLTGLPALSLPCGYDEKGLPMGLQVVSRPWAESLVLRVGHCFEQATGWHKRRPYKSEVV